MVVLLHMIPSKLIKLYAVKVNWGGSALVKYEDWVGMAWQHTIVCQSRKPSASVQVRRRDNTCLFHTRLWLVKLGKALLVQCYTVLNCWDYNKSKMSAVKNVFFDLILPPWLDYLLFFWPPHTYEFSSKDVTQSHPYSFKRPLKCSEFGSSPLYLLGNLFSMQHHACCRGPECIITIITILKQGYLLTSAPTHQDKLKLDWVSVVKYQILG